MEHVFVTKMNRKKNLLLHHHIIVWIIYQIFLRNLIKLISCNFFFLSIHTFFITCKNSNYILLNRAWIQIYLQKTNMLTSRLNNCVNDEPEKAIIKGKFEVMLHITETCYFKPRSSNLTVILSLDKIFFST